MASAPSAVLLLRLSNHHHHHHHSPQFTLHIPRNSHHVPSLPCPSPSFYSILLRASSSSTVPLAVSDSDSAKSLEPDPQSLLREVADSFALPADYFSRLPWDLRLDLNDAAFDLSNGPVQSECGEELGETLLNISRAWELADTSTSAALMIKVTQLGDSLTSYQKSALGKRLLSAGRRFRSMGQYDKGEVQRIAELMMRAGILLSGYAASASTDEEPKQQTRTFKFGELEVALTSGKAYVGGSIGAAFGILCWGLSQRVASVPDSSFKYANDNALLLAKSLQGFLLALLYSSTVLSGFVTIGLFLLAGQLKSRGK